MSSTITAASMHTATVTIHEIRERGTAAILAAMADAAQTPELALRYLDELSTDIEAALILDQGGSLAAASEGDGHRAARMRDLVLELFEHAGEAACQVEVTTPEGGVFAVREHGWTVAVVTGRFALPSLTFFDLRSVAADLGRRAA